MRSRTLREGSVGLLIIFSIVLFGGVILWVRGIQFGEKSYKIIADFADVNGIQLGDGVRYRGLRVGRVDEIRPSANGVDVIIEIDSSQLLIPRDVTLQARSSGLIGETFVDIVPESELSTKIANMSPVSSNCNPSQIICNNARLRGEKAVTLDDLLPYTYRFSKAYGEPEFVAKVNSAVENASVAAGEVANLTRDTSALVKDLQQEVNNVSNIAKNTSGELVTTAKSYQETAEQVSKLATNVEELIAQNKTNLTTTLDSIGTTSDRLQNLVVKIDKTVDATDTEKLVANLEQLTNNATVASKNLKDISQSFGSQESLVNLQQTLDSARVTFDNAQKITADLESITGDPTFLKNVRTLVDGLSNLVSSTEQLEQQIKTSQAIKPMQEAAWSISPNAPKIAK
jgi:phospholipid/cholesterol/gamma-HCH transport system substrate-binding protein